MQPMPYSIAQLSEPSQGGAFDDGFGETHGCLAGAAAAGLCGIAF